ncbi:hypothetical protein [Oceanibaculum nanhaiense]|uniref:hypothetical protein n=1 Tax=Oceanibaculum nanhaiense TaxID=1909734 RepID=UPI003D29B087
MTRVEYVRQQVPAALLTCAPDPAVPDAEMQGDAALYMTKLWEAGADCRGKLDQVRGLVEGR